MRVLFIYPNLNAEEGFNHGVAALSGALRARGHQTRLINLNESLGPVPSDEQIVREVRRWDPGFVAFSVMSQQYRYALRLARAIRAEMPAVPLGVGGVHATMCTEQIKQDGVWDFVGVGECDEALPELIDRLEHGDDPSTVPNFCIRQPDGTYRTNPLGPYPDLSALAPKDYEIFDLPRMLASKNGWQSMLTSRGCPYRCTYCFNREVADRYLAEGGHPRKAYLRHYPIERVLADIRRLKQDHPEIEVIIFDDDLFTLDKRYCIEFCKAYADAEIGIPFVLNAHVQTFTEPVARALAETPCMIVKFGVESGSERLRAKVLDRHMTNRQIVDAFQLAHAYGLHTSAFLMFGLPFETREMMDETIDLIAQIKPGRMRWAIFFPFPGTKSYTICQLADLIDHTRMRAMDNYFCASCLKFDAETDLFIRKLQRTFHWRVNARAGFDSAAQYQRLVEEVDAMSADQWREAAEAILDRDRAVSDALLARGQAHYSIRYTEVMAVHSDFVLAERGEYKNRAARRWRAFRQSA